MQNNLNMFIDKKYGSVHIYYPTSCLIGSILYQQIFLSILLNVYISVKCGQQVQLRHPWGDIPKKTCYIYLDIVHNLKMTFQQLKVNLYLCFLIREGFN